MSITWGVDADKTIIGRNDGLYIVICIGQPDCEWPGYNASTYLKPNEIAYRKAPSEDWTRPGIVCDTLEEAKAMAVTLRAFEINK